MHITLHNHNEQFFQFQVGLLLLDRAWSHWA